MASRILFNSAEQIDQTISGGYIALVLRGTGLIRNTGVQDISGAKYFYDTITFVSGLNVSGDFVPSGYTAGHLSPKTTNLYDLGDSSHEWRNLRIDGTGRIDNLYVDENASISGDFNVSGATYLSGDFIPSNIAADFLPKTNDLYSLGSNTREFKDLWINGTGRIDNLHVDENLYVTGNASVNGNTVVSGSLSTVGNTTLSGGLSVVGSSSLNQLAASSISSTGSISSSNSGVFGTMFITGSGIPTSQSGVGVFGQVIIGSGYLYACTGTNMWGRTHLTGWI